MALGAHLKALAEGHTPQGMSAQSPTSCSFATPFWPFEQSGMQGCYRLVPPMQAPAHAGLPLHEHWAARPWPLTRMSRRSLRAPLTPRDMGVRTPLSPGPLPDGLLGLDANTSACGGDLREVRAGCACKGRTSAVGRQLFGAPAASLRGTVSGAAQLGRGRVCSMWAP